ncbi:unnamed protein product [Linum tenue]|uniref:Bet v I/Major latex protein domain-containing protein n=1 Tax=Linum tenue TaxID=586396 RepID=A0AAV0M6B6_9ROSI|nr:unnamed protein product [Linum tenue]
MAAATADAEMSGKLEAEVELHCSPEKIYEVFRKSGHELPGHAPTHVQGVQVHEGEWDAHGTVKFWIYTCEGKMEVFKERVEYDDANRIMKLNGLEGDVMKLYKVYTSIYEFVAGGGGNGVAKLSIEYEKRDPSVPAPTKYLNLVSLFVEEADASLVKAG